MGMSPTGLKNFLAGSEPYSATRQKLECWLVRERGETAWADLDSARAALGLLVRELPLSRQERSAGRIAAVLREEYGEARLPLPAWLEEAE